MNNSNKIKTIVVLLGNARGGEQTWSSMYKFLLEPMSADLALLFGDNEDKEISLYKRAKYKWILNEYSNWREYYEKYVNGNWYETFKFFEEYTLGGGVDNMVGSGAIIFAFRHFLKNNFKNELLKYDRIILTRSDYYYIDYHPEFPNDSFYILEGEGYTGFTDRHHIFTKNMIDDVLGIVEYLSDKKNSNELIKKYYHTKAVNPETALFEFFHHTGIINKIKYCKRVQFAVSKSDKTRWRSPDGLMLGSKYLRIKYPQEYYKALKNKYGRFLGSFLRIIYNFRKKFL